MEIGESEVGDGASNSPKKGPFKVTSQWFSA